MMEATPMTSSPKYLMVGLVALLMLGSAPPAAAQADEAAELIATLESDAEAFDKDVACRRLAAIGGPEAVPALAALLADEKLNTSARTALQSIGGTEAKAALREALGELSGHPRIGVIETLGVLRDPAAASDLGAILAGNDTDAASAAAHALGRIATPEAARALSEIGLSHPSAGVRAAAGLGCVAGAESQRGNGDHRGAVELMHAVRGADVPPNVCAAATQQLIATRGDAGAPLLGQLLRSADPEMWSVAIGAVYEVPGDRITQVACQAARRAPPALGASLIQALGQRGDPGALPALIERSAEGETETRVAAVRALAQLGGAPEVNPLLAAALAQNETVAGAALDALAALEGDGVDAALAQWLDDPDHRLRATAIRAAGMRRMAGSIPAFIEAADAGDVVGEAAIQALGRTCGHGELPDLADILVGLSGDEQLGLAEAAVAATASRIEDKSTVADVLVARLDGAPADAKAALLRLLPVAPTSQALDAVRDALDDPAVSGTAYAVLGDWPTPEAAPDLLALAKAGGEYGDLGLRGYIRLIESPNLGPEEKMGMCEQAAALVETDGERNQLLGALATVPTIEALRMVMSHLDDPALRARACWAAVTVAEPLEQTHSAEVAEALTRVLEVMDNPNMERRVRASRDRAAQAANE
jgi:HEAT repeat protein